MKRGIAFERVAYELSQDVADYAFHLMVYRDTYEGNAYYIRQLSTLCRVLAMQFGCDDHTIECAVMYRKLGKTRLSDVFYNPYFS